MAMGRLSQRIAGVAVVLAGVTAGMAAAQVVGGGAQAGRGQSGPGVRAGQTGGGQQTGGRGPMLPGRRVGGWAPWAWGWGGTNVIVQEKEVEKESAFRPWVENKEYVRESLKPEMREYPEGSLAAPRMERASREGACELVLTDGARAGSERCERRAGAVTYIDSSGRKVWLSADLVNWEKSRFQPEK